MADMMHKTYKPSKAKEYTIMHNIGVVPIVSVRDNKLNEITVEIEHLSKNVVWIKPSHHDYEQIQIILSY